MKGIAALNWAGLSRFMKKSFSFSLIFLGYTALAFGEEEWDLVWSDEFEVPGLPSPDKWTYETGFVRNSEKQFYAKERSENARIKDGVLIIEARKERFPNPEFKPNDPDWRKSRKNAGYTSASLQTKGIADWTYGRIEVRARVPRGKGTWPAIWTLGSNIDDVGWPRCGEIDIMEYVGKDPRSIHATTHFSKAGKHDSDSKKHPVGEPWKEFHTYSIEWSPDWIHFAFDGSRYQSFNMQKADGETGNAFRKPHYLILNLAIGGSWGGEIDDSIFPCQFLIDYVRAYKPADQKKATAGD